jgi:predicted Zn-dependent peptidase
VASNLLAHVLGGGMSSRLFMELRERRGLCYQVGSYLTHYTDTGALQIAASCAPENVRELVQRTLHECHQILVKGISEAELERAKLQARTSLAFSQESSNSRMFSLAHQAIHQGGVTSLDAQIAEIDAVDLDQLHRVARALLDPASLGLTALGTRKGREIRAKDVAA